MARLLANRGIVDPDQARRFLNPSWEDFAPPQQLPDYDKAVKAILGARERGERIYVHGDYDVDGVSSTALFTRFLRIVGCDVVAHVPHREDEGYGIHPDSVQWAKEAGAKLFLTCDCGISASEQLAAVYESGMKAVVTDHHEQGGELPFAEAVVNPHRKDADGRLGELAGVGIVFKLCAGICQELGEKVGNFYNAYVDLAVLGTVADMMPLTGDNRIITHFGIQALRKTNKIGLKALMGVARTNLAKLNARTIGFQLGPRINAVGRIDDADTALQLLLTKDQEEAESLAKQLDHANSARRAMELEAVENAKSEIVARGLQKNYVIVLCQEGLAKGIVGLVAGRVVQSFRRPTFILGAHGGIATGSARSIPAFNLHDALIAHKHLYTKGGGHAMAAGISLDTSKLEEFAAAMDAFARERLTPEDFRPVLKGDAWLNLAEASPETWQEIHQLEPFGQANPEPVFYTSGANLTSVKVTSTGEHANLTLSDGYGLRQAMAFRTGQEFAAMALPAKLDIAYTLESDEWNGRPQFKLLIDGFRIASA